MKYTFINSHRNKATLHVRIRGRTERKEFPPFTEASIELPHRPPFHSEPPHVITCHSEAEIKRFERAKGGAQ